MDAVAKQAGPYVMKVSSLPFFLVFLSSLIPVAGSLLDVPTYHIPAGLALFGLVITGTSIRKGLNVVFHKQLTWAIGFLCLLLMTQVFTGRGFAILAAGGYVLIFAFMFYNLFLAGATASVIAIVRGVSFLYKFFVVAMIIETVIIILGKQPLLGELLFSENTPGYKVYNNADLARLFGLFQNAGGLNSVLLGSQIAGMLALSAVIWFVGVRKSKLHGSVMKHSGWWIVFSLSALVVSINATISLMVVLTAIIYRLFIKPKRRLLFLIGMSLFVAGGYFLIQRGFLFGRIFSSDLSLSADVTQMYSLYGISQELQGIAVQDYYVFTFLNPVYIWFSQDFLNKLIGVGAQFFINPNTYISGDFGFAADVILKSGLVWGVVFVVTALVICIPPLRLPASRSNVQQLWSRIGSINALTSLLWLFSTVHYNQAMQNPGGMMLFALHLALAIYCRTRSRALARVLPRNACESPRAN